MNEKEKIVYEPSFTSNGVIRQTLDKKGKIKKQFEITASEVFSYLNYYEEQLAELKADLKAKDLLVDCYMSVVGTLDNAKNLQQQIKEKDEEKKNFDN